MKFVTEPLAERHHVGRFECGKPELDLWLRNSAAHAERLRSCRTFVWHGDDDVVVAYFSLASHLLVREDLGKIGRGSPDQVPAVLLARLALEQSLHGCGYGGALVADALQRLVWASENVAVKFVVVDAVDNAAALFYERHGFLRIPNDPHRLVRKMSRIAADFGQA